MYTIISQSAVSQSASQFVFEGFYNPGLQKCSRDDYCTNFKLAGPSAFNVGNHTVPAKGPVLQSMKLRKRSVSVKSTPVPQVPAESSYTKPNLSPRTRAALHETGITTFNLPASILPSLTVAAKAFEGQLQACSHQPAPERLAGYTVFPTSQRLEYCPGHATLGNVGVLQQLADVVCGKVHSQVHTG